MNTPFQENPKKVWAWTMYDWANSVFSLTITTALLPQYYDAVSMKAATMYGTVENGKYYLYPLGIKVLNSALYSFTLSAGFLLIMLLGPLMSGIADARGRKLTFLKGFCYSGAIGCAMLYFMDANHVFFGLAMFLIALVGFGGSLVFYNAFLPDITTEDRYDRISARGFSMGYIGSVLLLILNLVVIIKPEWFFDMNGKVQQFITEGYALDEAAQQAKGYFNALGVKIAFITVAVWWAGFAQIPFRILNEQPKNVSSRWAQLMRDGLHELKKVWMHVWQPEHFVIRRYLFGFFFTSMGLQTVMYVATLFGTQELKLKTESLIITVLIIQLIAILGAWSFARISEYIGNIYTLLIMIVMWVGICFIAYGIQTEQAFYGLAVCVGLIMGGIQSMFRSTFVKIIPDNTESKASFFSFFDVCEKAGVVIGTLSFGLLLNLTGNMRSSILALAVYFVLGLFFMVRIKNFKALHP